MMPHPRSKVCSSRTRQAAYSHVHTSSTLLHPRGNRTPSTPSARMRVRRIVGHWLRPGIGCGRACRAADLAHHPPAPPLLYTFTHLYLILNCLQCWDGLRGAFDTMPCGSGLCRRPAPFPAHHQHDGPHVHTERVCWAALPRGRCPSALHACRARSPALALVIRRIE